MRLTYQTGIAALIHLGVITLLNIVNGVQSTAQQCTNNGTDCLGNVITSMIFFMLLTIFFALVWILAAATQTRRSRKLAFLLIGAEGLVILVSLFDATHSSNPFTITIGVINAILAAWVAVLALRLFISGGKRVTGSRRSRQRRLAD